MESAVRSVRDPCNAYASTCGGCTALAGCGFCASSGRCVSVSSTGVAVLGGEGGLASAPAACTTRDACGAYTPFKRFTCTASGRNFARCAGDRAEYSYCPGGFECLPGSEVARCHRSR